jgi:acyl-CoA reductase-like NAD-dependent aldehyde dehydrogenase
MARESFSRIEISCLEARPQSIRLRQNLFHSLHSALKSSEQTIRDAIVDDTSHDDRDISLEYTLAIAELLAHYDSLGLEEDLKSNILVNNPQATTGVGIVYIIPSKQNLFYSVISALTAALATGNCVVLEVLLIICAKLPKQLSC